jgi:hypothetical protein
VGVLYAAGALISLGGMWLDVLEAVVSASTLVSKMIEDRLYKPAV